MTSIGALALYRSRMFAMRTPPEPEALPVRADPIYK